MGEGEVRFFGFIFNWTIVTKCKGAQLCAPTNKLKKSKVIYLKNQCYSMILATAFLNHSALSQPSPVLSNTRSPSCILPSSNALWNPA